MQGGGTLNAGRYDPWGAPIDNQIAPFGFAGELQGDGGLVYLRARWYTPQQGVFTARDPFAGWAERPYSQHYFQYGYSNPVLVTDPSGRCAEGWEGDCFGPLDIPDPLTADELIEAGSGIVDTLPVIGDAKGLIEVFTGCDLATGEDLGHWRWLGLIALSELRLGRRLATAGDVGRGLRGAIDDLPAGVRHYDAQLFDGARKYPYTPNEPVLPQAPGSCADAAACMLAFAMGRLPQYIPIGATLEQIASALKKARVPVNFSKSIENVDELDHLMGGRPAIISVIGSDLRGNPARHAIVVDKIENGLVYIRDPSPPGKGSAYAVSVDDFAEAAFTGRPPEIWAIYLVGQ